MVSRHRHYHHHAWSRRERKPTPAASTTPFCFIYLKYQAEAFEVPEAAPARGIQLPPRHSPRGQPIDRFVSARSLLAPDSALQDPFPAVESTASQMSGGHPKDYETARRRGSVFVSSMCQYEARSSLSCHDGYSHTPTYLPPVHSMLIEHAPSMSFRALTTCLLPPVTLSSDKPRHHSID